MQRDEDEILAFGEYCQHTLENGIFNLLWDEFKQEHFALMMNTQPHETKKREQIYAEMNALSAFIGNMKAYVHQRQQIIDRSETNVHPEAEDISDGDDI